VSTIVVAANAQLLRRVNLRPEVLEARASRTSSNQGDGLPAPTLFS
jgi:hypothetical protein